MLFFAIVAPPLGLGNPVPNFEGKHTTCPSPTRHESIVVVTEALLEHAYLQSFVAFYSRLGVECFLIFHDDDLGASLPRLPSSVACSSGQIIPEVSALRTIYIQCSAPVSSGCSQSPSTSSYS